MYFGYARKWSGSVDRVRAPRRQDRGDATVRRRDGCEDRVSLRGDGTRRENEMSRAEADTGERKTACVYQIWDKDGGRKIRWVSPQYKDDYLKNDDDALGLAGFFNTPRPLQFIDKTDDMVPTALYALYENQAKVEQADDAPGSTSSRRAKRAASTTGLGADIENLLDADENRLVPAEQGFDARQGARQSHLVHAAGQSSSRRCSSCTSREQIKQVIYEIMGISDILRGATKASETLARSRSESTWGSLRLKPKQAEVQRYARDLMRMMVEIAASKFSQDTWAKITGLPYLTDQQAQAAQMIVQQVQAAAAGGDQQAAQQQLQMMQQQMKDIVKWSDVLTLLQDDYTARAFRVDIETNSPSRRKPPRIEGRHRPHGRDRPVRAGYRPARAAGRDAIPGGAVDAAGDQQAVPVRRRDRGQPGVTCSLKARGRRRRKGQNRRGKRR